VVAENLEMKIARSLQIGIVFVWKWHLCSILHFFLVLLQQSLVDSGGRRSKGRSCNEFLKIVSPEQSDKWKFTNQSRIANKLACQPEERLLEVIIGLGGDVVVLKVLLSVESNGLGLHLSLLDINLVSGKDDGNILADTDQIT
jgi:hypothetical protein